MRTDQLQRHALALGRVGQCRELLAPGAGFTGDGLLDPGQVAVQPVALPLEGVRGQLHPVRTAPGEHPLPVHLATVSVHL
ncbi:hypothetical protein AB0P37_26975, partial [Streptomyces antimycoticus]|uniref:hypothetical protein n=1 Tax=Streptomyces antimycoticus TaxID=68175 RepID=UPI00342256EA